MGGSKKSTSTTKNEIPAWLESGSKEAVGMARGIADRAYEGYGGQRVAGLSENEKLASEMARGLGSNAQYFDRGATALGGIKSMENADLSGYMNPYRENVLNNAQRGLNRQFESQRSDLARTSSMRGAFGGGRQTALQSGLDRAQLESTGDMWAQGYDQAFQNAQSAFQAEQDRKIAEAGAFGSLGAQAIGSGAQATAALAGTGATERSIDQAQADFDYGQFLERRDWDVTNLEPLLAALSTVPHSTTQTTTNKSKGSALSTLVGAATTLGGAYLTGGGSLLLGGAKAAADTGSGGGGSLA